MSNIDAGARRMRRETTDLDGVGDKYGYPSAVAGDDGPYVLHLIRSPGPLVDSTPWDGPLDAMQAARSLAGSRGAPSAWMDPSDWLSWSFPRGVPWTDYPVIGNPRVRVWRDSPVPVMEVPSSGQDKTIFKSLSHRPMSAIRDRIELVTVHLPVKSVLSCPLADRLGMEWLASAAAMADIVGKDVPVWLVDGERKHAGGRAELEALVAPVGPWRRFLFSYAANFTAIAAKALEKVVAEPDLEALSLRKNVSIRAIANDRHHRSIANLVSSRSGLDGLLDPLALQALYALRRSGGHAIPGRLGSGDLHRLCHVLLNPDSMPSATWKGTGRHPARVLDSTEYHSVTKALVDFMLIAVDGGKLVPSKAGAAFLDALHPDCEDPDMPLRWIGRPLAAKDAEAMDAWIARTFRKMKSRVNEI